MKLTKLSFTLAAVFLFASPSYGILTLVTSSDLPTCDVLAVPDEVHELGWGPAMGGPFPGDGVPGGPPSDEEITSATLQATTITACPGPTGTQDAPGIANAVVEITNLTGFNFVEVWYVGEEGTTFSNVDGLVNNAGALGIDARDAFRIDTVGGNTPLLFESITPNGIFEVGETWEFIIQDYVNLIGGAGGLPPDLFDSIGIAALSDGGPPSTGSIIAFVPEPSSTLLVLLGTGLVALRRRRS